MMGGSEQEARMFAIMQNNISKMADKYVKYRKKPQRTEKVSVVITSVAVPGCSSRIPDPDFYQSRIPDLGSRIQKQQQKRGVKKNLLSYLFM
jgi:hypothetical protein